MYILDGKVYITNLK